MRIIIKWDDAYMQMHWKGVRRLYRELFRATEYEESLAMLINQHSLSLHLRWVMSQETNTHLSCRSPCLKKIRLINLSKEKKERKQVGEQNQQMRNKFPGNNEQVDGRKRVWQRQEEKKACWLQYWSRRRAWKCHISETECVSSYSFATLAAIQVIKSGICNIHQFDQE